MCRGFQPLHRRTPFKSPSYYTYNTASFFEPLNYLSESRDPADVYIYTAFCTFCAVQFSNVAIAMRAHRLMSILQPTEPLRHASAAGRAQLSCVTS